MRCQRCGRPACPECQRPAAVGIQCVDCVREAARTTPSARTVFGGRATDGTPVVTYTLIGICAVVYLAQRANSSVTQNFAFAPFLGWTEPWRFVTAAFLHSPQTVFHILLNMFALWSLGQYLEPMLGRARFAALYLISGIGGQVGRDAHGRLADDRGSACRSGRRLADPRRRAPPGPSSGSSGRCSCSTGTWGVPRRRCTRRSRSTPRSASSTPASRGRPTSAGWSPASSAPASSSPSANRVCATSCGPPSAAVLVLLVAVTVGKYLTVPEAIRELSIFG